MKKITLATGIFGLVLSSASASAETILLQCRWDGDNSSEPERFEILGTDVNRVLPYETRTISGAVVGDQTIRFSEGSKQAGQDYVIDRRTGRLETQIYMNGSLYSKNTASCEKAAPTPKKF